MITNSPYQSHLFMNNIQVAIIEDEKPAARLLEGMIKKLRPQWDIIKIPGSIESSVAWFASHPHPDIVVLGFDTTLTYDKLSKACHFIRENLLIISK